MVRTDSPELKSLSFWYREEQSCLDVPKHVDLTLPPQVSRFEEHLILLLGYLEKSLFDKTDSGSVEIGHVHDRRAPDVIVVPDEPVSGDPGSDSTSNDDGDDNGDGNGNGSSNSTGWDSLSPGAQLGIIVGAILGVFVLLWLLGLMSKARDAKAKSHASVSKA